MFSADNALSIAAACTNTTMVQWNGFHVLAVEFEIGQLLRRIDAPVFVNALQPRPTFDNMPLRGVVMIIFLQLVGHWVWPAGLRRRSHPCSLFSQVNFNPPHDCHVGNCTESVMIRLVQ